MFNSDLIDDLARGRVVVFVGAGVSASAATPTGERISTWEEFLGAQMPLLSEDIRLQVRELLSKGDLLLSCEIIQSTLRDRWDDLIADEFGKKAEPSRLHSAIFDLDQRIVITTNFDKLLEAAWDQMDKGATHFTRLITKIDDDVFQSLKDHSRKYIIKAHGTVDSPNAIVFSRSDYIRSAFGNSLYREFLDSILLNFTVLFIGFSMNDPAIISLMEMCALRYPAARPHYIFSPGPMGENILEINKRLRKLSYIQYDSRNNHEELPQHIKELSRLAAERRREVYAELLS